VGEENRLQLPHYLDAWLILDTGSLSWCLTQVTPCLVLSAIRGVPLRDRDSPLTLLAKGHVSYDKGPCEGDNTQRTLTNVR